MFVNAWKSKKKSPEDTQVVPTGANEQKEYIRPCTLALEGSRKHMSFLF